MVDAPEVARECFVCFDRGVEFGPPLLTSCEHHPCLACFKTYVSLELDEGNR